MKSGKKTALLAAGALLLVVLVFGLGPAVQRWQQTREWQRLQDGCDAFAWNCAILAIKVTPACTKAHDPIACYHLAWLLDRGWDRARSKERIAGYYLMACRAGVTKACTKSQRSP